MSHQKTRELNGCFCVDYLHGGAREGLLQKFLFKNFLIRF